jgi:hypothetical protein
VHPKPSLPRRLARSVRRRLRGGVSPRPAAPPAVPPIDPGAGVRDLIHTPFQAADGPPRLTLVIPALDRAATFGGIQTALELFEALGPHVGDRRILSRRRLDPSVAALFPGWTIVDASDPAPPERSIASLAGTATGPGVAIRPNDAFIGTFWPTAAWIVDARTWQSATFGRAPARFGYVVQDWEPGFYPRSAQSMLARATYDDDAGTVAVFNTALLRDAFHAEGVRFDHEFVFEPRLSPTLRAAAARPAVPRHRRIVVYGRPGKPRNLFPILVDGLRAWVARRPDAGDWEIVSAGQAHEPVDLGGGVRMASTGKLDLDAYAELLRTSAIGISLMASPHPSYPPLEMASLGLLVLTNWFGAKDLSTWHANITSLHDVRAPAFAAALDALVDRFVADPTTGDRGELRHAPWLADDPPFPFAAELAALLTEGPTD